MTSKCTNTGVYIHTCMPHAEQNKTGHQIGNEKNFIIPSIVNLLHIGMIVLLNSKIQCTLHNNIFFRFLGEADDYYHK